MLKSRLMVKALVFAVLSGAVACAPPPRPRPNVVYVVRQPPAERVEVITLRPGAAHVWVGGFWTWRGGDFVWIPGHWEVPRASFREWVPGRWARDRQGWFFIDGHWR